MYNIYLKAFENKHIELDRDQKNYKDTLKSLIYYGVKLTNSNNKDRDIEVIQTVIKAIEELTAREFMQVFPIDKVYDGETYGVKDYLSNMEQIKDIGIDLIIEDSFSFLYDYVNMDTRKFTVQVMNVTDDVRLQEGKVSIIEEVMAGAGMKTYSLYTDDRGKEFMFKDGTTKPINKPKRRLPKYLKVIK